MKSAIANTDTIIDTIQNETENTIKIDTDTDIAEDMTKKTTATEVSDRDTRVTTTMMAIGRDTDMAMTDIAKRGTPKKTFPSPTKSNLKAKTPLIDPSLIREMLG